MPIEPENEPAALPTTLGDALTALIQERRESAMASNAQALAQRLVESIEENLEISELRLRQTQGGQRQTRARLAQQEAECLRLQATNSALEYRLSLLEEQSGNNKTS